MNQYTYEQENKGKNILIKLLIILILIFTSLSIVLTNYKKETLVCKISEDKCYIEKTNLANMRIKKFLINYSNIEQVTYMPQRVKGNRFAKGYTSYLLTFYDKKNNPVVVFSTAYFEQDKIKEIIIKIKKEMLKNTKEFRIDR